MSAFACGGVGVVGVVPKMISSLGYAYGVPLKRSGGSGWKRRGLPSFVVAGGARGPEATATCGMSVNAAAEQLRTQLGQLQVEAEATRTKANSARLRLLRLSEAAEKLFRQATLYIQNGKENQARELLLQRKKVMQALDKSKTRIEVLDKLSTKLNEAISSKERQLIENLTLLPEVNTIDVDHPVHIISPPDDIDENLRKNEFVDSSIVKLSGSEEIEHHSFQADKPGESRRVVEEEAARFISTEGDGESNFLKRISSFNNFLVHIDGQLREIETDLGILLKSSILALESKQKEKSWKVQQAVELLEDICRIRRRIASAIQRKTEET